MTPRKSASSDVHVKKRFDHTQTGKMSGHFKSSCTCLPESAHTIKIAINASARGSAVVNIAVQSVRDERSGGPNASRKSPICALSKLRYSVYGTAPGLKRKSFPTSRFANTGT